MEVARLPSFPKVPSIRRLREPTKRTARRWRLSVSTTRLDARGRNHQMVVTIALLQLDIGTITLVGVASVGTRGGRQRSLLSKAGNRRWSSASFNADCARQLAAPSGEAKLPSPAMANTLARRWQAPNLSDSASGDVARFTEATAGAIGTNRARAVAGAAATRRVLCAEHAGSPDIDVFKRPIGANEPDCWCQLA